MNGRPTLLNIIANQSRIYGERNRIRFGSLQDRIFFLFVASTDFKKLIRKKKESRILGVSLARILSRIVCVADYYGEHLPLAESFAKKWLGSVCRYCGQLPCACASEQRPDALIAEEIEGLDWDMERVSQHLESLYGEANRRAGSIDILYSRLVEEIAEIITIVVKMSFSDKPNTELLEELALELSDTVAWVITISNYLGINLQEAYLERYSEGCRKCQSIPCQCGTFLWPSAVNWAEALDS